MEIGFIGLGNMGGGMARNLLAACQASDGGHHLCVYDINDDAVEKLRALGADAAQSATDCAARAEVLFTSLPGADQIDALANGANGVDGDDGILNHLPEGAVWFETSTNELRRWQAIVRAAPAHLALIDAPVTGGAEGAAAGTLTMLLGGDDDALARADAHRDLLGAIAARVVPMGPAGAGYVAKLCQLHLNYLVAQGIGEALMLGAKAGLDLATLHGALRNSCAQSYVVDAYIPKVLDGSYDPSFALGLAARDMRLISELGAHLGVALDLGDAVYANYERACDQYGADAPHLSNIRLIEESAQQLLRAESMETAQ